MSRASKAAVLVVGGEPRVDLLPPEIYRERAAAVIRRRLLIGVFGVIAIVAVSTGASTVLAIQAQGQLADEQARTSSLLADQTKYIEVRSVQSKVALVKAAQQVGVSTEIDWKKYLDNVQATLPSTVAIDTVTLDFASPISAYVQPTAPLQGTRVGTVTFTAKSAVLPDVPTWLNALATLPGFADALPGSVTLDPTTKVYTVDITMHVNDSAYAKRFTTAGK
jgi:mRNA-degrading endonuclease toxin of MazEF toxin-antitoxin module